MRIDDIMKRNVKTISSSESVHKAVKKMSRNKVGSLIVLEKGRIAGIVTMLDVLNFKNLSENFKKAKVKSIMSRRLVTIGSTESIFRAVEVMRKNRVQRLPVVENGRLMGIITAADLAGFEQMIFSRANNLMAVRNSIRARVAF